MFHYKIEIMQRITQKKCFVISPIGDEGSEIRERSDQVLKHIITEPLSHLGFEVIRADKISEPGIITTQIIEYIVESDLVIADLTDKNPNVFYELAVRHAIRKPLVQMIKKGEIIPFDVAATRIIQFDLHNLDSVAAAKEEIISQVRSLESGKSEIHNPISVSLDLKVLKESGTIEERSLADVVEAISDLRLAVTSVDKMIPASKFFEEIKGMIDNLPSKLDSRMDPEIRRRRRRLHPMFFEEIMMTEMKTEDPNLTFLIMISFFKDDFPWLYEIGIETYRNLKSGKSKADKKKLVQNFERSLEILGHPMMRELYGKSEDIYMYGQDFRHFMHMYLDRLISEEKN